MPQVVIVDSLDPASGSGEWESIGRASGVGLIQADCHTEDELIAAGHDAEALIVTLANTAITAKVIRALDRCKIIARTGIGVDGIDLAAAKAKGIVVTNTPDYCIDEVSTHAVALLLACARRVVFLDRTVRRGEYSSLAARPMHRLVGSSVALLGFGRIGRASAGKLLALGLRVMAWDAFVARETMEACNVRSVDLETALRESDYVSVHLPLTPGTRHLIGPTQLAMMKPTAFLINTSRGGIIDQKALVDALQNNVIAGAALDVLEEEPPDPADPLLRMENVILTPHAAYYSEEALLDVKRMALDNVLRVLGGQPAINPVNLV